MNPIPELPVCVVCLPPTHGGCPGVSPRPGGRRGREPPAQPPHMCPNRPGSGGVPAPEVRSDLFRCGHTACLKRWLARRALDGGDKKQPRLLTKKKSLFKLLTTERQATPPSPSSMGLGALCARSYATRPHRLCQGRSPRERSEEVAPPGPESRPLQA